MPYINPGRREDFKYMDSIPDTPGELNYLFTKIALEYVETVSKELNYQIINDVVGALEGAKLEFYRRVAVPYEDKKIQENGDIYPEVDG